ncbi:CotH kinase family protein [Saprospiraceae bacterium]|nr:CotH kinase family protein [Saprospiraceae bacterium]
MMKNTFRLYTVILAILISFLAVGQGGLIFDDSYVHEVRITIDNVDFWSELSQNYQNNYPDVPYTMASASIDGEVTDSVGIRQKGFASHFGSQGDKKSMKIDFNHFVDGKKYDGLKKINLNNGFGDPAIQRDKLCYNIMNKAGVDAPRTSYARIYLNDQYWGLYLLVEQVDRTFLKDNFGNSNGNLFKNVGNSELEWMGQDTGQYQQIFELKTDPNVEAWENFVELMDVLNNTGDGDFKEEISKIFDVDLYLKVLAVDVATGNWDSYIEHGRNFYMYQDAYSRKFNWIPWDYNFALGGTFGSDFGGPGGGGSDEGNPNGNTLSEFPVDMSNSEKVLVNRLLAVPEYKERYYQGFCRLLDDNFTTERIFPLIEQYGDLVREDVLADPNYEWTAEQFVADLDQGDQISGLKWVFEGQVASLKAQLNELFDCSSIVTALLPLDVSINEFMAVNDSLSTIKDPAGETDDWIELYNNTDADIDLSNAFLSDNSDNLEKWQFPVGTTIRANDYLIIWADKDEDQEGLHADFKLNRDGDFIMLAEGTDVIDSLTFGFQENNLTYSRIPNGTGDYLIKDPTFGYNNEQETAVIDEYVGEIKVYPNPATQYIDVDLEKLPKAGATVTLTNGIGQTLSTTKMSSRFTRIDLNNLNGGIYLVTIQDEESRTIKTEKVIVFK